MVRSTQAPAPHRRRSAGRRCRLRGALWVALLALAPAACTGPFVTAQRDDRGCVAPRLETASYLYDEARQQLATFFKQRNDSQLLNAYYASIDSVRVARTMRDCYDLTELDKEDAVDLIRSAILLRKLVVTNMRDVDPGVMQGIYRGRYREIIKNDIY